MPACSARRGNELPRPILIFVAAKRNGSACSGRSSDEVRVRFYSSLSRRRTVSPAVVVTATRSAFDSNLRSREEEWFRLQTATKQRLHRFLNSSSDLGITAGFCQETPSSVQRFLISGSDLRIDVSFSPETASCVYRFLISRPDLRIAAAPSLLQLKKARLQRSRGVPAGTGCHEGGIILSKKPPEWRLFLPQQRSASDSNYRCCS